MHMQRVLPNHQILHFFNNSSNVLPILSAIRYVQLNVCYAMCAMQVMLPSQLQLNLIGVLVHRYVLHVSSLHGAKIKSHVMLTFSLQNRIPNMLHMKIPQTRDRRASLICPVIGDTLLTLLSVMADSPFTLCCLVELQTNPHQVINQITPHQVIILVSQSHYHSVHAHTLYFLLHFMQLLKSPQVINSVIIVHIFYFSCC